MRRSWPDSDALARYLAVHPAHLDDLDAVEMPALCDGAVVTVVYLEQRYGEIGDIQVWTDRAAPPDHQAVTLAGAMEALYDPHCWAPSWTNWTTPDEPETTCWLLRLEVSGDALRVPDVRV